MKKCVFAGTFDPPTTGHKKTVDDCLKIFDEVVVAVMVNRSKTPLFTEKERAALFKKLYADEPRVKVTVFDGAAVDLLARENTPFYVRGVRNTVDFEYENADLYASRKLSRNDGGISSRRAGQYTRQLHAGKKLYRLREGFFAIRSRGNLRRFMRYIGEEKCLKNR